MPWSSDGGQSSGPPIGHTAWETELQILLCSEFTSLKTASVILGYQPTFFKELPIILVVLIGSLFTPLTSTSTHYE